MRQLPDPQFWGVRVHLTLFLGCPTRQCLRVFDLLDRTKKVRLLGSTATLPQVRYGSAMPHPRGSADPISIGHRIHIHLVLPVVHRSIFTTFERSCGPTSRTRRCGTSWRSSRTWRPSCSRPPWTMVDGIVLTGNIGSNLVCFPLYPTLQTAEKTLPTLAVR